MRYLVTGGSGFIGSNFIRYIFKEEDDAQIINLDAMKYGSNPSGLKEFDNDRRYRFVKGDIADCGLISDLIKEVDAIVNFAAETHVDRSISAPDAFLHSNVAGVFAILEALRKNNPAARLVQISTDEVYGDIIDGSFRESDAIRPSSPYSASKAAADAFVLGYARTYCLNASITRCTNNYGPYQFPEKLIPKAIIRASMNLKIPVYGSGKNIRDWIHVWDHCRAVQAVLNSGRPGEVYNISAGAEKSNLEVVRAILKALGRDGGLIELVDDRPGHDVRYSLDSSKLRRQLGWKPEHSFDEGMRETVRWYVENEWWWRGLADERALEPCTVEARVVEGWLP